MVQNEVLHAIETRRSVRDFQDRPVEAEIIQQLLHAAVMAPSARNVQPWHFSLVQGRENIQIFGEMAYADQHFLTKVGFKIASVKNIFYNAPLLIAISGPRSHRWLRDDANLAAENILLAAHSLGLGSCWIGYAEGLNHNAQAKDKLQVPPDFDLVIFLILGYPSQPLSPPPTRTPKILKWIK